jgi:hypothetical protein
VVGTFGDTASSAESILPYSHGTLLELSRALGDLIADYERICDKAQFGVSLPLAAAALSLVRLALGPLTMHFYHSWRFRSLMLWSVK